MFFFQSTKEKCLVPGVYDKNTSLVGHIERLSDKNTEINEIDIVNLVVKYFVNFIIGGLENDKIKEKEINRWYIGLQQFTEKECRKDQNKIPQWLTPIQDIFYQLSMLGCPSTISILQSIICQKSQDILGNKEYKSVDLGAGSGILQLAFYIKGRRNGLIPNKEESIGVEINQTIAQKSDKILDKLGVGRVRFGDSTDIQTFKNLGIPNVVHDIGNENLTNAFSPLYNSRENQEPFVENLRKVCEYFDNLVSTRLFPNMTVIWVKGIARGEEIPNSLPIMLIGPDIKESMRQIEKLERNLKRKGNFNRIETYLYPEGIDINGKMVALEDVGNEHIVCDSNKKGYFYESPFMPRRWIYDPVGASYFFE